MVNLLTQVPHVGSHCTQQIERVLVAVDTETSTESIAFSHLRDKCSCLHNKTFHSLENVSG